jgi:hypothetical protein
LICVYAIWKDIKNKAKVIGETDDKYISGGFMKNNIFDLAYMVANTKAKEEKVKDILFLVEMTPRHTIELHLNNLIATYGIDLVKEVIEYKFSDKKTA